MEDSFILTLSMYSYIIQNEWNIFIRFIEVHEQHTCNKAHLYKGLLISLFMIMASNIGPSRTTNSIIRWIRESKFLQKQHN